jgi:hypothetical protein
MSLQRFKLKEKLDVVAIGEDDEDFIGQLKANFPELDLSWPDGTADDEADKHWCDAARSILTGANDDLDLKALANGPGGATVNLVEIRAIFVVASRNNTTTLTLTKGAADGWTGPGANWSLDLKPGASLRLCDGKDGQYPTGAADKVLRVTNGAGATATYAILIVGVSA